MQRYRGSVIVGLASIVLVVGWKTFWFMSDDAFIAFRYISNSLLGHGYVWNAPPFLPIEGYTSLAWIWILELAWRWFGVEPPASANTISLVFALGTLLITARFAWRVSGAERLARGRAVLMGLVLLGLVSNRTFLAWSSSGLETALFNFLVIAWVYVLATLSNGGPYSSRRLLIAAGLAALIYLTRPDGVLFCLATLILFGRALARRAWTRRPLGMLAALPLLALPIHLLWRMSFYGSWLPNTYVAKHVSAWPQSGIRYLASFVLEYALWLWFGLTGWALVELAVRRVRGGSSLARILLHRRLPMTLAVLTLVVHATYYTFVIGGDHFEYRVYSHAIPLILVSLVWAMGALRLDLRTGVACMAAFLISGWLIPWTHWTHTRGLTTREETFKMRVAVAPSLPPLTRWYGRMFDAAQTWLIDRYVCMRHQEHKVFGEYQAREFPRRAEGARIPAEGFPVLHTLATGLPAWRLPHVFIIDGSGLNDYVVARTPLPPGQRREMAHDRRAPPGYVESFRPNVQAGGGEARVYRRTPPLTAEEIRTIESRWRRRVDGRAP